MLIQKKKNSVGRIVDESLRRYRDKKGGKEGGKEKWNVDQERNGSREGCRDSSSDKVHFPLLINIEGERYLRDALERKSESELSRTGKRIRSMSSSSLSSTEGRRGGGEKTMVCFARSGGGGRGDVGRRTDDATCRF